MAACSLASMPSTSGAIVSSTLRTACCTPLPRYRWASPSRSSTASRLPVDAPDGAAARPQAPDSSWTSTSIVGFPRESRISRPYTPVIADISGPPLEHEIGERADGLGGGAERHQQAFRLLDQLPRPRLGRGQAVKRGIGRLLLALVAPRCFPELREIAFDVEDIIHDLKREPERPPRPADGLHLLGAPAPEDRPDPQRDADERGRLVQVDVVEPLGRDGLALRPDVHHLPADEAVRARVS